MKLSLIILLALVAGAAFAGSLPDPVATPGAVNPNVTQANIDRTICVPGWSKTVRPPASYTNRLKMAQLGDGPYKVKGAVDPKKFEEDHLVSIELGGHPREPKNLWPEPWDGDDGAHRKDVLENRLHRLVCARQITLQEAQRCIAHDWQACLKLHP